MYLAEPNHKRLAILLAGLCLIGLLVIVLEYRYPPQFKREISAREIKSVSIERASRRHNAEALSLSSLSSYAEIMERPLFRSTRRPPDPVEAISEAQQAAAQAKKKQEHIEELFALSGVVMTKNKTVALLRNIKNRKSVRVSEGERVKGWQVERVYPDRVLFSHNGRAESLELIRDFELASQNSRQARRRAAKRR